MVGTMALLHAFTRTARTPRTAAAPDAGRDLATGLPADDEVLLDAPDDRLGPALVAAGRGEFTPAAALLAATREAAEWEHRDRYAQRLAAFARSRPEWFEEWCAAAPDDPDALLLRARLAVDRVWESPARAELLHPVGPLIAAAAEAGPRDPVPWRIALDHARGTRAGSAAFEGLWAEAVRRCPHHYGSHVAALHYLAEVYGGTEGTAAAHRACLDFAEPAADDAPPGSLLAALPLRAAYLCLSESGGRDAVPPQRLHAAADRAIALSSSFPPAEVWPAPLRNLLVYVLIRLERWTDALEQLRLTGPYATSFPWDRDCDDPLGRFLRVREEVRERAGGAGPGEGSGGRSGKGAGGGPLPRPRRSREARGGRVDFPGG
ncbi:hypothetical protein ACFOOM_02685 [Streptomyces echinoruber]|uniref:DUF4034 domain-containing protein n=1 Tax=Streptomyces echinoruber TaxID=68898 RepID=A0A918QVK3_9ACTN|nr:hypothetical protein [Streptomyces echinoruber]GGZ69219.1 hypothetical protein GCM10010389_03120 [Streptomyces echinoruber]